MKKERINRHGFVRIIACLMASLIVSAMLAISASAESLSLGTVHLENGIELGAFGDVEMNAEETEFYLKQDDTKENYLITYLAALDMSEIWDKYTELTTNSQTEAAAKTAVLSGTFTAKTILDERLTVDADFANRATVQAAYEAANIAAENNGILDIIEIADGTGYDASTRTFTVVFQFKSGVTGQNLLDMQVEGMPEYLVVGTPGTMCTLAKDKFEDGKNIATSGTSFDGKISINYPAPISTEYGYINVTANVTECTVQMQASAPISLGNVKLENGIEIGAFSDVVTNEAETEFYLKEDATKDKYLVTYLAALDMSEIWDKYTELTTNPLYDEAAKIAILTGTFTAKTVLDDRLTVDADFATPEAVQAAYEAANKELGNAGILNIIEVTDGTGYDPATHTFTVVFKFKDGVMGADLLNMQVEGMPEYLVVGTPGTMCTLAKDKFEAGKDFSTSGTSFGGTIHISVPKTTPDKPEIVMAEIGYIDVTANVTECTVQMKKAETVTDPSKPTEPSEPTNPAQPTDPSTPSTPGNGGSTSNPSAPQTGDTSNIALYAVLMLASVSVLSALLFKRKNKKQFNK